MAVRIDDKDVHREDVRSTLQRSGGTREVRVKVAAGPRRVAFAFLNPSDPPPEGADPKPRVRALYLRNIEVQGPMPAIEKFPSEAMKRILVAQPGPSGLSEAEAARRILETFTRKAFRRPVLPDEVSRYVKLYETARAGG